MKFPVEEAPLAIATDASQTGIGACLEQFVEGMWQPISFYSKSLLASERKYSAFDLELLAARSAIKHFRWAVEGRPFILFTDHKPLISAMKAVNPNWSNTQHRRFAFIAEYTNDIRHKAGKDNVVADLLSRRFELNSLDSSFPWLELAEEQETDTEIGLYPTTLTSLKFANKNIHGVEIIGDVSTGTFRPILPERFLRLAFEILHNISHPGARASTKLVLQQFVWHKAKKDCAVWAKECHACQRAKVGRHTKPVINQFNPPTGRFKEVHIDIVGPLQKSEGKRYLLTMVDRFTGWPEAYPLEQQDAIPCAVAFLNAWVARFGVPERITTDRGRQFESDMFQNTLKEMGIKPQRTTAYHPQSNGLVERFYRRLKEALKARLESSGKQWMQELPVVLLGLRSAMKEDLKCSTAELVYGETLRLPGAVFETQVGRPAGPEQIIAFKRAMARLRYIKTAHHGQTPSYIPKALKNSEFVYVRRDAVSPPLTCPYDGPYHVIRKEKDYFKLAQIRYQ